MLKGVLELSNNNFFFFLILFFFRIADLYNWCYNKLGNLPHVSTDINFQVSNPGFLYNIQFINVPDFNGVGESTPSSYFYQV